MREKHGEKMLNIMLHIKKSVIFVNGCNHFHHSDDGVEPEWQVNINKESAKKLLQLKNFLNLNK
jgi:hypothetical protein